MLPVSKSARLKCVQPKHFTSFTILGQPSPELDCACATLHQCQTNSHCCDQWESNDAAPKACERLIATLNNWMFCAAKTRQTRLLKDEPVFCDGCSVDQTLHLMFKLPWHREPNTVYFHFLNRVLWLFWGFSAGERKSYNEKQKQWGRESLREN